jgi:hypothetical protein
MVQIYLKAEHFYFITYQLKNTTINQYFSLVSRIKTTLTGNTDLEATFTIDASPEEVVMIFRMLTILPEGIANKINVAMDDLLTQQIQVGYIFETANGLVPDQDGNLPPTAYWHMIARDITYTKDNNTLARTNAIAEGKLLIDQI